jgi:hypothetical protein
MTAFIHNRREAHGGEPICMLLPIVSVARRDAMWDFSTVLSVSVDGAETRGPG